MAIRPNNEERGFGFGAAFFDDFFARFGMFL